MQTIPILDAFRSDVFRRSIANEFARPAHWVSAAGVVLAIAAALALLAVGLAFARRRGALVAVVLAGLALAAAGAASGGITAAQVMSVLSSPNERDLALGAARVAGSVVAGGGVAALGLVLAAIAGPGSKS